MSRFKPGDPAPGFALPDDNGIVHRLSDQTSRWTVIYFYPKDDTPGCTVEACAFRDANTDLAALGATVWGISPQDARSHARFRAKFSLSFPLLVDADHAVADAYGAWVEKNRYGRTYWGNARSTFLVDPGGRIARAWEKVTPEGHADEVLAELRSRLGPGAGSAGAGGAGASGAGRA